MILCFYKILPSRDMAIQSFQLYGNGDLVATAAIL